MFVLGDTKTRVLVLLQTSARVVRDATNPLLSETLYSHTSYHVSADLQDLYSGTFESSLKSTFRCDF